MGIVSSEIVINRPDGAYRFVREIHTDNLGVAHPYEYAPALDITQLELDANLAAHAIEVESNLAEQEIQQWIGDINNGLDPVHVDAGGFFVHSEPNFNTWEDAADGAIKPFLQAEYMQDILICQLSWSRLTKAEGELIAGKNNEVNSEMAIATNTQTTLDAYIPLINEEGLPRA